MRPMRLYLISVALTFSCVARAQTEQMGSSWLSLAYTYTDLTNKQTSLNDKGRFAGIRGELGLSLFQTMGLSIGGEYQDGNMNYDGATLTGANLKTISQDYIRDLRGLVHLFYQPVIFSGGIAQRYWYSDLGYYRRRQQFDYIPVMMTIGRESMYFKFEWDVWQKGKLKAQMSDVSAAEKDTELTQKTGSGFGVEVGYLIPSPAKLITRIYVSYHEWNVHQSDVVSDGVYSLTEPQTTTTGLQAGIGLDF